MNGKPFVSIIIPVYNVENVLARCLESILAQTYVHYEVILINDGSTDNSMKICQKYVDKQDNFNLITQENKGLSATRNRGIELAKGNYILFVDSDDWIEKTLLQEAVQSVKKYDSEIVVFGHSMDEPKGKVNKISDPAPNYPEHFEVSKHKQIILDLDYVMVNKLYKTNVFNQGKSIRFYQGRYYEDLLAAPQILLKINKISIIRKPLYHYVIGREEAITTTYNFKKFQDIVNNLRNLKLIFNRPNKHLYEKLCIQYTMFFLPNYIFRTTSNKERYKQYKLYKSFVSKKYTLKEINAFNSHKFTIKKYSKAAQFFIKLFHFNPKLFLLFTYIVYKIKK